MALVFDASSYFTRRQSDLRYVRRGGTITPADLNPESFQGGIPGEFLAPNSIEFRHFLNDVKPPRVVAAKPALPDEAYPEGSQIAVVSEDYRLYKNVADVWVPTVNYPDLGGSIEDALVASSIHGVKLVPALPSLPNAAYPEGALIYVSDSNIRLLYQNINDNWKTVVQTSNLQGKVTADLMAANSVIAGTIAAGAVNAPEILSDRIIKGRHIVAEEIDTEHLKAQAIKAGTVDFVSLSGDTAAVNWITTGMLRAGAVVADKMLIGDFENLVDDPSLELGTDSWTVDGNGLVRWNGSNWAKSGNYSFLRWSGSGMVGTASSMYSKRAFQVIPGQKIAGEAWTARSADANGSMGLRVQFFTDRAMTQYVSALTFFTRTSGSDGGAGSQLGSGTVTVPAGALWARIIVFVEGHSAGLWTADDVYARKKIGSAYIDNLSADIITTGTLNGQNVNIINLNATNINAGVINASRISVRKLLIQGGKFEANKNAAGVATNGTVTWYGDGGYGTGLSVVYNGATYSIPAGSTTKRYVYFNPAATTQFYDSDVRPSAGMIILAVITKVNYQTNACQVAVVDQDQLTSTLLEADTGTYAISAGDLRASDGTALPLLVRYTGTPAVGEAPTRNCSINSEKISFVTYSTGNASSALAVLGNTTLDNSLGGYLNLAGPSPAIDVSKNGSYVFRVDNNYGLTWLYKPHFPGLVSSPFSSSLWGGYIQLYNSAGQAAGKIPVY